MTARGCGAMLTLVVLGNACAAPTFTVVKTQAELQAKLAPRFPVTREKFPVGVTLSDPKVILRSGDPRVGLDLATEVRVPFRPPVQGRIAVIGEPYYDAERKSFFLRSSQIERVDLPGFDLSGHHKTRAALDTAVGVVLASTPVYTLEDRTWKEVTAKHFLKEVSVVDGKLHMTLGP